MNLREKALRVATKAHAGQKRKTGEDFITHPVAVAELVVKHWTEFWYGRCEKFHVHKTAPCASNLDRFYAIAVLHDVLEDTSYTEGQMRRAFGHGITSSVKALTHAEGTYTDYILGFIREFRRGHLFPLFVKLADLEHNLSTWPDKSGSMRDKWELARAYLKDEVRRY